ncbi:reticulocyte-binding protein 2 homolog a-like isoform X1 [Coturnix japonica]|uniref:reticulocyte-binding protein 2 homolog a-like isoform X1 n=1 Tax=Coturnix japonica TaxID=93934 RepID=UPI0013A5DBFB|nr:reticulocyte-binding protein 2 homolog a-like isoform X1 [Coturnix japonica]
MRKMKSPEMSCLFCVMLLIQSVHAETLDVCTWDQANHRLLIVIIALDSILLLIIPFCCCFFLVKLSKDPKRGTSISTPRKLEEGKQDTEEKEELLRGRNDREEELRAMIDILEKKNETLEKEKATLKEEKDILEKKNETLEKENEALKEDKETLDKEKETLKKDNGEWDCSLASH